MLLQIFKLKQGFTEREEKDNQSSKPEDELLTKMKRQQ